MRNFVFLDNPHSYNPHNFFIAHLSRFSSKDELFRQLNVKLNFPTYFGFNWDALSDCLRDFNWIEQQRIALIHDVLPELKEQEMIIYLQILFDAIGDWEKDKNHYLEVVFPIQSKEIVDKFMLR